MSLLSEVSIITPTALYVQQVQAEKRKPQTRAKHRQIQPAEIKPTLRAMGRHITHRYRKGMRVHVPAMSGNDWSHFLRALEVTRAFN
ncbi:hypothetical protein CBK19_22805 [Salmonella enterica subsp. enterica serovar Hillingdon]|uniref:hypothetical protein n=1 Tax=Salmonella enterica TaxID=28901 RepID=UPI0009B192F3|nr:hypothetical protein [Salmonella enterica]EBW2268493.1 hypothetical protein [Salmonella enterica subsp. enterica serovar Hillingdon]ECB6312646.1 hypothetical protein [Salmonella enterica subsp. enterica serovar Chailey]EDR0865615.1 hypothetical protein [Salmonella enterica subsp. enterica serovar Hillingdon]EDR6326907.1 hypothetical protein [Salmonella enterica subsp. enterica serovar Hillingdon]